MKDGSDLGVARGIAEALERMQGFDQEEDFTTAGAEIDLTSGNLPNGDARALYKAVGVHNFGATDCTLKYTTYEDATVRTLLVLSGADKRPLIPIKLVDAATTSGATLKFYFKDRAIVNGGKEIGAIA